MAGVLTRVGMLPWLDVGVGKGEEQVEEEGKPFLCACEREGEFLIQGGDFSHSLRVKPRKNWHVQCTCLGVFFKCRVFRAFS